MTKWHDDAVAFGASHIYCDDASDPELDTVGSLDLTTLGTSPTAVADAYSVGDRVTFEGAVWESVIDANVWSPTGYPAGWKAV